MERHSDFRFRFPWVDPLRAIPYAFPLMLHRFLRFVACLGLLALPTLLGPDTVRAGLCPGSAAEAGALAYGACPDAGQQGEASLVHADAAARILGYRPGGARQKTGESPRPALANTLISLHRFWLASSALPLGFAPVLPRPRETRRTKPLLI